MSGRLVANVVKIDSPIRRRQFDGYGGTCGVVMTMNKRQWTDLQRRAQQGDSDAQWQVGYWFEDGLTDPKGKVLVRARPQIAVRWYRRSACAGNVHGQMSLGNCLSTGRGVGVRRDDAKALFWYKLALRQGDSCAPNNIATIYRDRGDNRRAIFWYRRAVAAGDRDALVEIGVRCYDGIGTKRDATAAVHCFRKAIASKCITQDGCEHAMYRLGLAYFDGRGVRKSLLRAIDWISRANRDNDHPCAQKMIETITREMSRNKRPQGGRS